ncbi:MAG: VOC family protein [Planctomycetales bacterium]|nr:VOC family protein [Planctomycetales bacterium]
MASSKLKGLVAFAHVSDVPSSIEFYLVLGFAVDHTFCPPGSEEPTWVHLQSENAHLMLARASEPVIPEQQAVLFYLYFSDIEAKYRELKQLGIDVGEMTYPPFCPKGEFRVYDPDGYCLMLTHV